MKWLSFLFFEKKKKENLEREREDDDKHLFASPPFGKPTNKKAQKYKKELIYKKWKCERSYKEMKWQYILENRKQIQVY